MLDSGSPAAGLESKLFCATKHVEVKDGYWGLVLVAAREKVKIDRKGEQ